MPERPEIDLEKYVPESELVLEEHLPEKGKFPVIDGHVHISGGIETAGDVAQVVEEMDAAGLTACVDLDGNRKRPVSECAKLLKEAHPGRFYILAVMPWQKIMDEGGDIGRKLADAMQDAYDQGADGLKIHKTLGLRVKDPDGKLLMPDDERIQPLFAKCAQLKAGCLFHVADPTAFFKPVTEKNERWEEIAHHPSWHFHGDEFPSFEELMERQEKLVEMNPDTVFQSAHVAGYSENLGWVSTMLDRYPNFNVDISARLSEIGRQPYTSRKFFVKYADRIVYGTDVAMKREWQRIYFRCLETRDEYFSYSVGQPPGQGRWHIYGLGLPDDVLEKVYSKNARRIWGETPR